MRKISRREMLRFLGAGVAGAAITACRPQAAKEVVVEKPAEKVDKEKEPAKQPVAAAPVELSLGTWWLPPTPYGEAQKKAVEAFNEAHPNIQVTSEPFQFSMEKWQAALAGGVAPDVTQMPPHFHHNFSARGAMLAVDDMLDAEPDVAREDFWPQTMERLTWDGKLWGLPAEVWFTFTFVNLDMLEEAGLEMPDWDWTYSDFLELATALTKGEGVQKQYGSNAPTDSFYVPVWAWGGEMLDALEETCLLDSEPATEAIQWIADLIVKHGVSPSSEDLADTNTRSFFESGRVGMHWQANWYLSYCEKSATMEWDVIPHPIGPAGRKAETRGANFGIFEQTKHPDESWVLMLDLSTGQGQEIMITESALFPTLQRLGVPEKLPHYSQNWIDVTRESAAVARAQPMVPPYVEMRDAWNKELSEVWVGRKTAREATDALVPAVNKILAEA